MPQMNTPGIKASDVWAVATRTLSTGFFTDYHYYADLAIGANYVPPAKTLFSLVVEFGVLDLDALHVQLYDGAAWIDGQAATPIDSGAVLFQDTAQSLRIINSSGAAACKISLTGVTWS